MQYAYGGIFLISLLLLPIYFLFVRKKHNEPWMFVFCICVSIVNLGYMARHHEELEKTFTDEQKETFEKFHDCWNEYMSLAEAAIFEYAFKLGARLAIEVQADE